TIALFRCHALASERCAPHDGAKFRRVIFQREIGVTGTSNGEIRNLTIDPEIMQILVILDDDLEEGGELINCHDASNHPSASDSTTLMRVEPYSTGCAFSARISETKPA